VSIALRWRRQPLVLLSDALCDAALWRHQIAGLSDIADIRVGDLTRDDSVGSMAARVQGRHTARGEAPKGFSGTIEAMVLYIRNEVILPAVGPHGDRFVPYLGTIPGQIGNVTYGVICNTDEAGSIDYICGVQVREFPSQPAEFARLRPALVVLDLGLPGIDGLEFTRRVRRDSDVPILMVTARSGEGDKLLGLEIGADDYVTKPFSTAELTARVRALLRRSTGGLTDRVLEIGNLRIDPGRRSLERDGVSIPVTTLEFDVLYFLASRPGRVFSREALMEQVWGSDRVVDDRSIDSLISRVRRKLESDPSNPRYLQTVWGAGYRFAETSG
jgi:DNA-binding response OmpR family regulator